MKSQCPICGGRNLIGWYFFLGMLCGLGIALITSGLSTAHGAEYAITVLSVYDGDTIVADITLPPQEIRAMGKLLKVSVALQGERVRIAGIQAPELNTAAGKRSRDELASWLPKGTAAVLRTYGCETEKYGRGFGRVLVNGADLSDRLVSAGLAVKWDGKGRRP